MTEYEINLAVADKLCVTEEYATFTPNGRHSFDPCNNAQQAWEIMLKHNISVTKDGDGYYAFRNLYYSGCGNWHFDAGAYNEKPFVAAMILFLEI